MNKNEFIEEIKKLNINVTDEMLNQLEIYKNYLQEYNKHTNLTTIINDEDIYLKHFYDSLTITRVVDLNKFNTLLDIGTGAGFPGMVLKIFFPNLKVTLLDSNNKKTTFLENLKKLLSIDVEIINKRCEEYARDNLNKFDIVTSRAVANLRVLSEISLPLVKVNGLFIPLKGSVSSELEEATKTITIMNAKILKVDNFNLYNDSGIRNILVIQKLKETNKNILRPYNQILKKEIK